MSTPKLTPAQIDAGWIEIESEEQAPQIRALRIGYYDLLHKDGLIVRAIKLENGWKTEFGIGSSGFPVRNFIAYRPVPSYEEYETLSAKYRALVEIYNDLQRQNSALVDQFTRVGNQPTMRDQFAMAAFSTPYADNGNGNEAHSIAEDAYRIADAMLEARKGVDTNAE